MADMKRAKPKLKRARAGGRPFGPDNPGKRFEKGCKPGPGRPPLPPGFRDALDTMEPEALAKIRAIITAPDHRDALQAAEYVLNQKHGKPTQRTELGGIPGGSPIRTETEDESIAAFKRMIKGPA